MTDLTVLLISIYFVFNVFTSGYFVGMHHNEKKDNKDKLYLLMISIFLLLFALPVIFIIHNASLLNKYLKKKRMLKKFKKAGGEAGKRMSKNSISKS